MPAFSPDFNHNTYITRRVRLDLPRVLPSPYKEMLEKLPYAAWLKVHAAEVQALTNSKGEKLLTLVHPRMAHTQNGTIFVTDFVFMSQTALDYYNTHHLSTMRGRIEENYPGATIAGSPFAYRIALDVEKDKFAALIEGISELRSLT